MRALRLGIVAVLVGAASACSVLGGDDDPDPAGELAEDLAAALSGHSLGDVPLATEDARATFAELVEPLDEVPVAVEVTDVREVEEEGRADATLAWRWEVTDAAAWEYETTVRLVQDEDGWRVGWMPDDLAPDLSDGDTLGLRTLSPRRGDITGAGGVALVTERPVRRFGLDKTRVEASQVARSARRIARTLDVDATSYAERARAMGPDAFVEAVVLREEDARDVPSAYTDIPGAVALSDTLPLAPTREFAAALLGRVGPATAEIVEESEGRILAGDEVGLSGLQARYDEQLTGTPGTAVVARDAKDRLRTLFEAPATDGADLATTLDPGLQQKAEAALASLGDGAPASALVAIRPSDGAILASANGVGAAGADLASTGQYAPGSTFKVVSALALLRSGLAPADVVSCPATTVVDGRTFKNYDDYPSSALGDITLTQAVAQSCNTAFIGKRRPVAARRPRRRRPGARARHRPRPRLPRLLRPGAAAGDRDGSGGRHDRAGDRAREPVRDGDRRGVGLRGPRGAPRPASGAPGGADGAREAAVRGRGRHAAQPDEGRGDQRVGAVPPRRTRSGRREDRHGGVRRAGRVGLAAHPRLDDRDPWRPGRGGLRRHGGVGLAERRTGARGVPALRPRGCSLPDQRRAR
jgi:hypothetical protein